MQKSAIPHQDHLEEYKVSPKTIERDGRFAEAVDTLASGLHPVAQVPGLAVS